MVPLIWETLISIYIYVYIEVERVWGFGSATRPVSSSRRGRRCSVMGFQILPEGLLMSALFSAADFAAAE